MAKHVRRFVFILLVILAKAFPPSDGSISSLPAAY